LTSLYARLQQALEALYRIEGPANVDDFRIDASQLALVMGCEPSVSDREMLLVLEDGEHTDIALFIDDEIAIDAEAFIGALGAEDRAKLVDAFCVALEGVSHFVYLTYCGARLSRPVSRIELELQAELDKFLLLRLLFPMPELIGRLFDRFEIDRSVAEEDRERYHVANQRARRYARWLEHKFKTDEFHEALEDARELYRKPLSMKLDHIARAA
jgi:hypothetical protein